MPLTADGLILRRDHHQRKDVKLRMLGHARVKNMGSFSELQKVFKLPRCDKIGP